MIKDDWTQCPKCTFPGLHSQFVEHLATDATCPMCEQPLTPEELHKVPENEVVLDDEVTPEGADTGASRRRCLLSSVIATCGLLSSKYM